VRSPSPKLLLDFIALEEAAAAEVQRYAQKWGVLGLCKHGQPAGRVHAPRHDPCPPTYRERLSDWISFARSIGAAVRIGLALRARRFGADEDWRALRGRKPKLGEDHYLILVRSCHALSYVFGELQPVLVWDQDQFRVLFAGRSYLGGLRAALAFQALALIAGTNALANCSECGVLFEPKRKPNLKFRSYCQKCGIHAAWRAASQKRRNNMTQRAEDAKANGRPTP